MVPLSLPVVILLTTGSAALSLVARSATMTVSVITARPLVTRATRCAGVEIACVGVQSGAVPVAVSSPPASTTPVDMGEGRAGGLPGCWQV
jgi:hypothetical protein